MHLQVSWLSELLENWHGSGARAEVVFENEKQMVENRRREI